MTGQRVEVHSTAYPYRSAFITALNNTDEISVEPYIESLLTKGWVHHGNTDGTSDGTVLRRDEGDECVLASGGLTINSHGGRGAYYSVHFQQWECEYDRSLLPGTVDLARTPGFWLETNTQSFAKIITTEGFRERSFEIYRSELEGSGWMAVAQGPSEVGMRRTQTATGPCLTLRHYKEKQSGLNLVELEFSESAKPCPTPNRFSGRTP